MPSLVRVDYIASLWNASPGQTLRVPLAYQQAHKGVLEYVCDPLHHFTAVIVQHAAEQPTDAMQALSAGRWGGPRREDPPPPYASAHGAERFCGMDTLCAGLLPSGAAGALASPPYPSAQACERPWGIDMLCSTWRTPCAGPGPGAWANPAGMLPLRQLGPASSARDAIATSCPNVPRPVAHGDAIVGR